MGLMSFGKAANDYINTGESAGPTNTNANALSLGATKYPSSTNFRVAEPTSLGDMYKSMGIGMTAPSNVSVTDPATGMTNIQPQNSFLDNQFKSMQIDSMRSNIETNDLANAALFKEQNSLMGQMSPYIQGFAGITHGLGSLAGIYTGFQQLDIAKSQLGIAEEQWGETKKELARVKKVRSDLNTKYTS